MHCTRRQFAKKALLATAVCGGWLGNLRAQPGTTTYTVLPGDTLGHIALRHGISTAELKRINRLDSDLIRVGQELQVPRADGTSPAVTPQSSFLYTVSRGDTLGSIALAHGVGLSDLRRANGLQSDLIRVGQKLKIPAAASSADLLAHVRARTARIKVRTHNWNRIIVHHSAIKYGNAEVYGRAHRERGMPNGLAYHFVIGNGIDSGDGEIEIGPRWEKQLLGGHVRNYRVNLTSIGICLVGNFQEQHPTRRQLDAFTQLVDWLRRDIVPGAKQFAGHRDIRGEQTICPGKNFPLAAMHARYG